MASKEYILGIQYFYQHVPVEDPSIYDDGKMPMSLNCQSALQAAYSVLLNKYLLRDSCMAAEVFRKYGRVVDWCEGGEFNREKLELGDILCVLNRDKMEKRKFSNMTMDMISQNIHLVFNLNVLKADERIREWFPNVSSLFLPSDHLVFQASRYLDVPGSSTGGTGLTTIEWLEEKYVPLLAKRYDAPLDSV
ncbi:hypothetical protein HY947_01300 [Candidatus Gottesmanbacteria bacterium]|nr:hypothetical protein [Candidatus Gottesmanbacteria bacterium]